MVVARNFIGDLGLICCKTALLRQNSGFSPHFGSFAQLVPRSVLQSLLGSFDAGAVCPRGRLLDLQRVLL